MILQPSFIELAFFHIAAKVEVSFKAFINKFSDQFVSNWENTQVYGRMDPIGTFKGTVRRVSIDWSIPSDSLEEAKMNFHKSQTLISMLYPVYDHESGRQPALKSSPLLKVKMGNLLIKSGASPRSSGGVKEDGLVCSSGGFIFTPEIDEGFFFFEDGNIYPQTNKFSCTLQIYHDVQLGWREEFIAGEEGQGKSGKFSEENSLSIEFRKRTGFFPYSSDILPYSKNDKLEDNFNENSNKENTEVGQYVIFKNFGSITK